MTTQEDVTEFGVGYEFAVHEHGTADAGSQGEDHDDARDITPGPVTNFGQTGGISVVDEGGGATGGG